MSELRCDRHTSSKGVLGRSNYWPCSNPAKYTVKYSWNKRDKTETLCGVHYRHFKNSCDKLNIKFEVETHDQRA